MSIIDKIFFNIKSKNKSLLAKFEKSRDGLTKKIQYVATNDSLSGGKYEQESNYKRYKASDIYK